MTELNEFELAIHNLAYFAKKAKVLDRIVVTIDFKNPRDAAYFKATLRKELSILNFSTLEYDENKFELYGVTVLVKDRSQ